jgi:hypothetical protein
VRSAEPLGGGVDPTPAMSVSVPWSRLAAGADATISVDSVGADVSLARSSSRGGRRRARLRSVARRDGAFVAKRDGADGHPLWATSFPTFCARRIASRGPAGGDVLVAGTAFSRPSSSRRTRRLRAARCSSA